MELSLSDYHSQPIDGVFLSPTDEYLVLYSTADPEDPSSSSVFSLHYAVDIIIGELQNSKSISLCAPVDAGCFIPATCASSLLLCSGGCLIQYSLPSATELLSIPLSPHFPVLFMEADLLSSVHVFLQTSDCLSLCCLSSPTAVQFELPSISAFAQLSASSFVCARGDVLSIFSRSSAVLGDPIAVRHIGFIATTLVPATATEVLVCGHDRAGRGVCQQVSFASRNCESDVTSLDSLRAHTQSCFAALRRGAGSLFVSTTDSAVVLEGQLSADGRFVPTRTHSAGAGVVACAVLLDALVVVTRTAITVVQGHERRHCDMRETEGESLRLPNCSPERRMSIAALPRPSAVAKAVAALEERTMHLSVSYHLVHRIADEIAACRAALSADPDKQLTEQLRELRTRAKPRMPQSNGVRLLRLTPKGDFRPETQNTEKAPQRPPEPQSIANKPASPRRRKGPMTPRTADGQV
jgi:hypothetical protein